MGTDRKELAAMADEPTDAPAKDAPDQPADDLGESGKRALEAERKARREAERQSREMAERLKALEDRDKSESERLTEKIAQLEKDLSAAVGRADRFEVALDKGLDMVRAKRLSGTTKEELEADAEELKSWTSAGTPAPPGKPTEDLKGGGDPTQDPEPDIRKVVDSIPRGF